MRVTAQLPGLLGQESISIYCRQVCDVPGVVPGLQGALSNGGISAHGKRSIGGQAPLCPVLCHRIPSLAHSRTLQGWGHALDQEQGRAPGPHPLGSEIRGWDLKASGVLSSSQIWTSQGLPGLTLPGLAGSGGFISQEQCSSCSFPPPHEGSPQPPPSPF